MDPELRARWAAFVDQISHSGFHALRQQLDDMARTEFPVLKQLENMARTNFPVLKQLEDMAPIALRQQLAAWARSRPTVALRPAVVELAGAVTAVAEMTGEMTVTPAPATVGREVVREALGAAMLVVFIVYMASWYVAPLPPAWQAQLLMLFAGLGYLWQDWR